VRATAEVEAHLSGVAVAQVVHIVKVEAEVHRTVVVVDRVPRLGVTLVRVRPIARDMTARAIETFSSRYSAVRSYCDDL
jgi:hypothetical protein